MRGNNVMGIIFSNMHEELMREITENRTMGSVPFGGRYRLIDFTLSNMVNSGIDRVGVITKRNYQSLMDHLGTGKSWDLSRRHDGLFILPPFGSSSGEFTNRVKTLYAIKEFIKRSKEEYILIADCNVICNIDYQKVIANHINKNADITVIYKRGILPSKISKPIVLSLNNDNKIKDVYINPKISSSCSYGINMFLMKRDLILKLIAECVSKNEVNFSRDIIQNNVNKYKIYGYEFDGFSKIITSINSYFEANMDVMNIKVRNQLFDINRPIYTKVRDDMSTKYGLQSIVKNSLIANGCVIDGEVENSIVFRGVKVNKGAKVSNCVLMQDTIIGEKCTINYVISDKDVIVKEDRTLMGFQSYPVYISKASMI